MKITSIRRYVSDWSWRFIPILIVIGLVSLVLAKEIVTPQMRLIKFSVVIAILTLMFRFEMLYSLYLFIFLFPFPSSISIGSTNSILMTLIVLIWFVRANSEKANVFIRTDIDKLVILLLGAYVMSLFNVESFAIVKKSLVIIWKQVSAFALFYLIVRFITDERKLLNITQIITFAAGLTFLTGVIEIFLPGKDIIPGWISVKGLGVSHLSRYGGVGGRIGGALGTEMLSDFAAITLFFVAFHFIRAINPITKLMWFLVSAMTVVSMLGTANRGALMGLMLGLIYFLFIFRKKLSLAKIVSVVTVCAALFIAANLFLQEFTLIAPVTERFAGTEFKGVVPDTRVGVWGPALEKSMDHILFGHGPPYEHGQQGTPDFWPHNAYIFYLFTLGLLGVSAFLLIAYRIIKLSLCYKNKYVWRTPLGNLAAILHIQIIVLLFLQLRTDHQREDIYLYIIWMFFGLVVATSNVIKRKAEHLMALEESASTD
ncbi:MAG: O-antigen ligase family protein [Candidatus Latescibacterota bacterium]